MALSIFRRWALAACRSRLPARAASICVSSALLATAACADFAGPRQRPTGERPDTGSTELATLLWYELDPRVIIDGVTDSVRFTVRVRGNPVQVQIQLRTGLVVPLTRVSAGSYQGAAPVDDILFTYRVADLHTNAGFIDVTSSNAASEQTTVAVNVKDAVVPTIPVQEISSTVQIASHVMNIRYDSLYLGGQVPPDVLRQFYEVFGDDYDFISVLEQVHTPNDYFYFAARNDINGLGLQTFDRGDTYGSAARLQGILHFPVDAEYDPARTAVLHELAHRWMNFSNLPNLRDARPHFPISTLAFGVTGRNDPDTDKRVIFRFALTPQPDGSYRVTRVPDQPRAFNDMELYLLGLIPPDSVGPHIVFVNQNQEAQLTHNGVLAGPVETVTVAEWIAREGPRAPAYSIAQRNFRMATIVLSRGRLLSREEMSFYNYMATRGESVTDVQYTDASTRLTTLPFFLATGGRATLSTELLR